MFVQMLLNNLARVCYFRTTKHVSIMIYCKYGHGVCLYFSGNTRSSVPCPAAAKSRYRLHLIRQNCHKQHVSSVGGFRVRAGKKQVCGARGLARQKR